MVKAVMSSMTMAMVSADDVTALLQMSASVRQSQGQRILAAVAEEGNDTICVQAAAGDVAPVTGSFTARMSQQAVVVPAGSVAGEAGSFCVSKHDVLLIQRTLGLHTARDFEAALDSKNKATTTTTTMYDWATFDFKGDVTKEVTVKAGKHQSLCDRLFHLRHAQLDQTMAHKSHKCLNGEVATWTPNCCGTSSKHDIPLYSTGPHACSCCAEDQNADQWVPTEMSVSDEQRDDQLRVCECRNFLKSTVDIPNFSDELEKMQTALAAAVAVAEQDAPKDAALAAVLLQRNFDAALASKKINEATTTTTTTINPEMIAQFESLTKACTAASTFPGSWTQVAKELNDPKYAGLFQSFNITGGWQHCDKSWVVKGACGLW